MSTNSFSQNNDWKQTNYSSVKRNWAISRYARLKKVINSNTQAKEKWEFYDCSNGDINLSILNCNRMIIAQGHRIFENHDLVMCSSYLRGITRGDSMVFFNKIEDNQRQFRIQFASKLSKPGAAECQECRKELSKFFPYQNLSENAQPQASTSQNVNTQVTLAEESSVSDLSNHFLNPSAYSLPYIYKHSPLPIDNLEEMIWLCLSDKQFPAFVSQVGEVLKDLTDV